jgi:hypothetical protein
LRPSVAFGFVGEFPVATRLCRRLAVGRLVSPRKGEFDFVNSKRQSIQGLLLLASLGFFLPFVAVSCQGTKVATLTGVQLLTGTTISGGDFFQATLIPPNPYLIVSVALGLSAFLLGFKARVAIFSFIALACTLVSSVVMLRFQDAASEQVRRSTMQAFSLEMETGYWISFASYLLATAIGAADYWIVTRRYSGDPTAEPADAGAFCDAPSSPPGNWCAPEAEGASNSMAAGQFNFCPSCGERCIAGKGFCANCGEQLV